GGPSAASTAPSGSPETPTSVPSAVPEGIVHPTGADEIVLRYEDVGGFTPPEWQAGRLPYFTLYGDGRVVFQQTTAEPAARGDDVFEGSPLRTALLTEDQVQGLLEYALTDGGLAIAKTEYQNPMVADAPTAVFTINAENDSKTVSAMALGLEGQQGVDSLVLGRLAQLGERLRDFDQGGTLASDPYLADAYRGVLFEQQGIQGVQVRDWPWADVQPSEFTFPADPNALQQGTRTLTPEDAAAVGVPGFENGISGVYPSGPDGKTYSLVIRPLLPDEAA
ncbi:MAG: hypothetical protein MUQ32_04970, partial [Chloroflexi bacterium]|nr:hypothetical protein [Chloroflexota bacterium]